MTTATATKSKTDLLEEIREAIHAIILEDLRHGANDYAYVRVWPDLSVTSGRESSYCVPESEYFGRTPHCVTVWSVSGVRPPAGNEDVVFVWVEAGEGDAGAFFADGQWWTLSDRLIDNLDLDDVMTEVESRLDESDQTWWDALDTETKAAK